MDVLKNESSLPENFNDFDPERSLQNIENIEKTLDILEKKYKDYLQEKKIFIQLVTMARDKYEKNKDHPIFGEYDITSIENDHSMKSFAEKEKIDIDSFRAYVNLKRDSLLAKAMMNDVMGMHQLVVTERKETTTLLQSISNSAQKYNSEIVAKKSEEILQRIESWDKD